MKPEDVPLEQVRQAAANASAEFAGMVEGLQRAVAAFAREWPPERIAASAIEEHNRRMDEFNGRAPREDQDQ